MPNPLQAIQKQDKRTFTDLKTPDGARVFDQSDATSIIEKLSQQHVQHALERCEVHDLPKLILTKRIDEGGKALRRWRALSGGV